MKPAHPPVRRTACYLLGGYAVILMMVLLLPLNYASIVETVTDFGRQDLGWWWINTSLTEGVANILLFIPVGLLITLAAGRRRVGVVTGVAVSMVAELAQTLIPDRVASPLDLLTNTMGAAIGAGIAWLLTRRGTRAATTD